MGFSVFDVNGNLKLATSATTSPALTVITSTSTGTQNDWAPGIVNHTLIKWSGASDMTVTGLASGVAGQSVIFKNTGTSIATFSHDSGSSVAANQLQNMATSAGTPVAATGYIIYIHDGTDWKMFDHEQGTWITPAFAAGDYTGSGSLTWTVAAGDVSMQMYRLQGKTLSIRSAILTTSTGGTAAVSLQVANGAWGGFAIAGGNAHFHPHLLINAGGTAVLGRLRADTTDTTHLLYQLVNGGNWSNAAVDNTYVYSTVILEVT